MALEYFTIEEFRALPQMSDTTKYPTIRVEGAAAWAVERFEGFCGVSFIPRTHTDIVDGSRANANNYGIVLTQRRALTITALEQDGVALTAAELLELKLRGGVVKRYTAGTFTPVAWNVGLDNIEITYTAGYAVVPGDIKDAALQATKARLLATNSNAGIDDRRTSMSTEQGTINFVVAGKDQPTGFPEIDAVLLDYKARRAPLVR